MTPFEHWQQVTEKLYYLEEFKKNIIYCPTTGQPKAIKFPDGRIYKLGEIIE